MDPVVLTIGTNQLEKKTNQKTQSFLSDPQNLNSYSYVKNNPLKYIDPNGEYWWAGYDDYTGYAPGKGEAMKSAEIFGGRNRAIRAIERNEQTINDTATKYGVGADLIKAIIYEETSHLTPGEYLAEKNLGIGDSVGLGQIRASKWGEELGFTREELMNENNSIEAIGYILNKMTEKCGKDCTSENFVEKIGTMYNNEKASEVSNYGERIGQFMNNQIWARNEADTFLDNHPLKGLNPYIDHQYEKTYAK